MFVFATNQLTHPKFIINFPTKRHWRGQSRIEDIETGLIDLRRVIQELNISSIAIPPLGSGLGGLNWADVRPLIEGTMGPLENVRTLIYEPKGAPTATSMVRSQLPPRMTTGRAALVELISRYLGGFLDPFVTLLEIHKLLFFLQEAGEPLRLHFKKANHGPYAENLRHVFHVIEGHLISGYADGGDSPSKPIQLIPGAIETASSYLADKPNTQQRLARVTDLVKGFETPFGLELLATVYWVSKKEFAGSIENVYELTYQWGTQKDQFSKRQITIAYNVLKEKCWI
jgi:O-acetyl-ADP-ribose deacetylase (regulator of RNase III)